MTHKNFGVRNYFLRTQCHIILYTVDTAPQVMTLEPLYQAVSSLSTSCAGGDGARQQETAALRRPRRRRNSRAAEDKEHDICV